MKEVEQKKYSVLRNTFFLMKESWKFDRRILVFSILTIIFGVVLPLFSIYLPKISVDLLVEKAQIGQIALELGTVVAIMLVLQGINGYLSSAKFFHYNDMHNYFTQKLFFASIDCNYAYIENGKCMQMYRRAIYAISSGDTSGLSAFFCQIPNLIISISCFFLYSGIISSLHIAVVFLLLLTSAITYYFQLKENSCFEKTKDEYARVGKQLHYTANQCSNEGMGKDIRVYDMSGWIAGLIKKLHGKEQRIIRKRRMQGYKTYIMSSTLNFARDGLAYAYLIIETVQGNIGMGDFMLYFGAIAGFSSWIMQIVEQMGALKKANIQINDLRTFLEIPAEDTEKAECGLPDVSDGVEIEFNHVSFCYPGSQEKIISDLSFRIEKGERVALVGLNGAGKTTLVKLLTGMYEPTSGQILMNGVDIAKLGKKDVYSLLAAVFQDVMILPFRLDENIALVPKSSVDAKRVDMVMQFSGLYEELKERNITKDSYMTKQLTKEGVFLSGGQEQKFLLARALYKEAPVLVLDEPTAALDPIAEKEMYEKYEMLCEDRTALFISHRLASTQFSDRIFFMKNGKVTESGSHKELLDAGGEYAHLYEVQSYYYNDSKEQRGDLNEC